VTSIRNNEIKSRIMHHFGDLVYGKAGKFLLHGSVVYGNQARRAEAGDRGGN
jgi:hypothetical protein